MRWYKSLRWYEWAFVVLVLSLSALGLFHAVYNGKRCEDRGGVRVRGALGYECVTPVPATTEGRQQR